MKKSYLRQLIREELQENTLEHYLEEARYGIKMASQEKDPKDIRGYITQVIYYLEEALNVLPIEPKQKNYF